MVATTITFDQLGVQPPVYVAGGFTNWTPTEMKHEPVEKDGVVEHHFSFTVDLAPGEYQYKFRLGPGDWWVLDESTPTTNDGAGNINNILTVKPEQITLPAETPAGREPEVPVSTSSAGDTSNPIEIPSEAQKEVVKEADEPKATPLAQEARQDPPPPSHEPPQQEPQPPSVTPDTAAENFDASKEHSIPDVAPPPYEEHHAVPASAPSQETSPAVTGGIEKKSTQPRTENVQTVQSELKTAQSWLAQNPVLVAAIVVVPVVVSFIWWR